MTVYHFCDKFYNEFKDLENPPLHPQLSSIRKPSNLLVTPINSHYPDSYRRGRFTHENIKPWIVPYSIYRFVERAFHLLDSCVGGMLGGSGSGIVYNATSSLNISDSVGWVIIAATGKTMTATCPNPSDDPGNRQIYSYRRFPSDPFAFSYVYGGGAGTLQPDDEIEIGFNSILADKMRPKVVKVTGIDRSDPDNKTITFEVNMDVSAMLYNKNPAINDLTLETVEIKSWRYAGNLPKYVQVIEPGYMKCVSRSITINAADIPEDGRILLKNTLNQDCRIAYYKAGNSTLGQNASLRARARISGVATTWTDTIKNRIKVEQLPDYGGWKTWLCLKTTDWDGSTDLEDISAGLESLTLTYFPEATVSDTRWQTRTSSRCRYAHKHHDGGAYNMPDGEDTTHGACSFCKIRKYQVEEEVLDGYSEIGLPEYHLETTWPSPTGVPRYRHECYMPGTCDKFDPLENGGEGERQWTRRYTWKLFFKRAIAGVPLKIEQFMPGLSATSNFAVGRPSGDSMPSLRSCLGHHDSLTSHTGMHVLVTFPNFGLPVGPYEVVEDEAGNREIVQRRGYSFRTSHNYADILFGDESTYPEAGALASVDGWGTRKNPIAYNDTIGLPEDPFLSLTKHEDGQGLRIECDTGIIKGRTQDRASHVLTAAELLIIERISTAIFDTWQTRANGRVKWYSTPVTLRTGKIAKGVIELPKLTPGGMGRNLVPYYERPPIAAVSGTVHQVIDLGGNVYRIVFENTLQKFSILTTISAGNSYDRILSFKAGGGIVEPPDYLKIDDFYGSDKTIGDTSNLAHPGDAIQFETDLVESTGISDFAGKRFKIIAARAFNPDYPAANWGQEVIQRYYISTGYFQASTEKSVKLVQGTVLTVISSSDPAHVGLVANASFATGHAVKNMRTGEIYTVGTYGDDLPLIRAQYGTSLGTILPGDILQLVNVVAYDGSFAYTQILTDGRPEIGSHQYWVDPRTGRMFFAQSDMGNRVKIFYALNGEDDGPDFGHTVGDYYLCQTDPGEEHSKYTRFKSGLDADTYGSFPRTLHYTGGVALTEVVGFVEPGEYSIIVDAGGEMNFYVNEADAGKSFHLTITTDNILTDLDAGGEIARTPGFTTYGKYMDTIDILDDSEGFFGPAKDSLEGVTGNIIHSSEGFHPLPIPSIRAGAIPAEFTVTVPDEEKICESGASRIYITPDGAAPILALGPVVDLEI